MFWGGGGGVGGIGVFCVVLHPVIKNATKRIVTSEFFIGYWILQFVELAGL
jgi:hypothetical protein